MNYFTLRSFICALLLLSFVSCKKSASDTRSEKLRLLQNKWTFGIGFFHHKDSVPVWGYISSPPKIYDFNINGQLYVPNQMPGEYYHYKLLADDSTLIFDKYPFAISRTDTNYIRLLTEHSLVYYGYDLTHTFISSDSLYR